jgi:hypothetical protein
MRDHLPKPHIRAKVRFYESSKGGLKESIPGGVFGCIFGVNNELFDSFMVRPDKGPLNPGDEVEVYIQFLNPQMVVELLKPGTKFILRQLNTMGEGEVIEILPPPKR